MSLTFGDIGLDLIRSSDSGWSARMVFTLKIAK